MTNFNDPKEYMVEVRAHPELAPLAIQLFEKFGAYQVPDSPIIKYSKNGFAILLYIDNVDILDKVKSFSPVTFAIENGIGGHTC